MTTVEAETPEVRAEARFVRTAPRKAQLVTEQIRGRTVPEARTILAFTTRDAARDVEKVLNSAVANAEANHDLIGDELYVSAAYASAGPVLKRWRARARGRVARIRKRTCHITIRLAPTEGPAEAPRTGEVEESPARREKATRRKKPEISEANEAAAREPSTPGEQKRPKRAEKPKAEAAEGKPARPRRAKPKDEETGSKPKRTARRKQTEEGT
jgi:large subunit ribosomal protein L22